MKTQEDMSLVIAKKNMFNNSDICIKEYRSSFACVCEKCMKEMTELVKALSSNKHSNE